MRNHQCRRAGLVEMPTVFGEQAVGGTAGNLQGAGNAGGGEQGRLGVAGKIAGEEEQDAVGALQAGLFQGLTDCFGGQFRQWVRAADEAAGGRHSVFPLNSQRSTTTQRLHSGLRALQM